MVNRNCPTRVGPSFYLSARPVYLIDILVQPISESQVYVLSKRALTRAGSNGVAFFDFRALLVDPSKVDRVFLEIRPASERTYYPQWEDGATVVNGLVSGVAQLGAPQWPLHQDEQYEFRLLDQTKAHLVEGTIIARANAISGTSPWLLAAIGLVASIVQLLSVLWPWGDRHLGR